MPVATAPMSRRNPAGTFTFASLDAFAAGRPTTFTRNVGDPLVSVSQVQLGLYVQDDIRVRKDLTIQRRRPSGVSVAHRRLSPRPRGGIAWSPFKSGKTTIRGGGGIFFDWFDAQSYEQGVQLDGTHQQIETIVQPGYPDPTARRARDRAARRARAVRAGSGRSRGSPRPIVGVEQTLPGEVRLNTMYIRRRGSNRCAAST